MREIVRRNTLVLCLVDEVGAAGRDLGPDITGVWAVLGARRLPVSRRIDHGAEAVLGCDRSSA
jgi:hypothetical protein